MLETTPLAKRMTHWVQKRQNSVIGISCLLAILSAPLPDFKKSRRTRLQLMDSANNSGHIADFFISFRIMLNLSVTIPHFFHYCVIKQIQTLCIGGSGPKHPPFYGSNCFLSKTEKFSFWQSVFISVYYVCVAVYNIGKIWHLQVVCIRRGMCVRGRV